MKVIAVFALILSSVLAYGQTQVTRYTPKGSPVRAYNNIQEMSSAEKTDWSNYVQTYYPNATEINAPSATKSYNCHAYAWHVSEGGDAVWIGYYQGQQTDEDIYWTDSSYVNQTSEVGAEKISYYDGNHSAVQTITQGIYVSKWGEGPLMQHSRDYGPYNMAYRNYYILQPSITGPSQICDQETFTIDNMPSGASVVWTTSGDLSVTSGQDTSTVIISRTYDLSLNTYIRATISVNGDTIVINKTDLQLGTINPSILVYDSQGEHNIAPPYYTGTTYQIVAYGSNFSTDPDDYTWTVTPPSGYGLYPSMYNGKQFTFSASNVGSYRISLSYNGECGWSDPSTKTVYLYQGSMKLSLSPNPATDMLTVSLIISDDNSVATTSSMKNETSIQPYSIELWNEKDGLVRKVEANETVIQIPLQDLPRGMYFVHLVRNNQMLQRQIIWLK